MADVDKELDELLDEIHAAETVDKKATRVEASPPPGSAQKAAAPTAVEFSTYATLDEDTPKDEDLTIRRALPTRLQPLEGSVKPLAALATQLGTPLGTPLGGAPMDDVLLQAKKGVSPPKRSNQSEPRDDLPQEEPILPLIHVRRLGVQGGIVPRKRWGQSMVCYGDSLFVFGGCVRTSSNHTEAVNDFFEFNLIDNVWEPCFCSKGAPPSPRYLHASIVKDSTMVVFGGCNEAGMQSDVHTYNFATQEWAAPASKSKKGQLPRSGHSAVLWRNRMVVFGGKSTKEGEKVGASTLRNDVECLDLTTWEWKELWRAPKKPTGESDTQVEQAAPCKRRGHAAAYNAGVMYIHGGDSNDGPLQDTWMFTLRLRVWSQIETGLTSIPRQRHAMAFASGTLVVLGGSEGSAAKPLVALRPRDADPRWHTVPLNGVGISTSIKGSSIVFNHGFLYVFGGTDIDGDCRNDMLRGLVSCARDTGSAGSTASAMMKKLLAAPFHDMVLEVQGRKYNVHRLILDLRAPHFLQNVLQCHCDEATPPRYTLDGNKRMHGLPEFQKHTVLEAFLAFLYHGALPNDEEADELQGVTDAALRFHVSSFTEAQRCSDAAAVLRRGASGKDGDESSATAAVNGVVKDLQRLLSKDTSPCPTDAVLHVNDPHTQESNSELRTYLTLLRNAIPFLATLFEKGVNEKNGVTWKREADGAVHFRNINIPVRSVASLMQYVATGSVVLRPEDAHPALMAASFLGIPRLQRAAEQILCLEEVFPHTACDYLLLAMKCNATYVREYGVVAAAFDIDNVRQTDAFKYLPSELQAEIESAAIEMRTAVGHRRGRETVDKGKGNYALPAAL